MLGEYLHFMKKTVKPENVSGDQMSDPPKQKAERLLQFVTVIQATEWKKFFRQSAAATFGVLGRKFHARKAELQQEPAQNVVQKIVKK